jgi:hypothetical protein
LKLAALELWAFLFLPSGAKTETRGFLFGLSEVEGVGLTRRAATAVFSHTVTFMCGFLAKKSAQ